MNEQTERDLIAERRDVLKKTLQTALVSLYGRDLHFDRAYAVRCECFADFGRFLGDGGAELLRDIISIQTGFSVNLFPDREYAFTVRDGVEFDDLLAILQTLTDSHCMVETLAPIDKYTGKRTYTAKGSF